MVENMEELWSLHHPDYIHVEPPNNFCICVMKIFDKKDLMKYETSH